MSYPEGIEELVLKSDRWIRSCKAVLNTSGVLCHVVKLTALVILGCFHLKPTTVVCSVQ